MCNVAASNGETSFRPGTGDRPSVPAHLTAAPSTVRATSSLSSTTGNSDVIADGMAVSSNANAILFDGNVGNTLAIDGTGIARSSNFDVQFAVDLLCDPGCFPNFEKIKRSSGIFSLVVKTNSLAIIDKKPDVAANLNQGVDGILLQKMSCGDEPTSAQVLSGFAATDLLSNNDFTLSRGEVLTQGVPNIGTMPPTSCSAELR